jgi:hypothetical protein
MSAPELRAAVRAVLDGLDESVEASVVDTLIARATKTTSGWRPTRPFQRIVEEAKSFADAARHIGHADPYDVTEHLRRGTKAFLAGDHASARAVFEAILPPIACVDIDLGQHELVEEVLGVDTRVCVSQYVTSVYATTPLRDRADAVLRALEQVEGVGTLSSPIKAMEDVSAGALPDLRAFLPSASARQGTSGRPSTSDGCAKPSFVRTAWAVSSGSRERRSDLRRASLGVRRSPIRVTGLLRSRQATRRRGWCAGRTGAANSSTEPHSRLRSLACPISPSGWKPHGAPLQR